ncbi:DUF2975 domain-containing protein [Sphingomonas donggukensis]|uniref:DUF2975 domain-containing protein n=1 Tax=Sphingomonas donggukensis TaxID=2949093 RepID=A0ABY4TQN8_9SPHN|nr:DUF2975 domain-containing protein [Sphingomonas donggukensis]URW74542.1 DUF2975 domain-containing protein [Sphingomonas donggukensis]
MSITELRKRARLLKWLVTIPFVALVLLAVALVGNIVWQGGRYADGVAIYYLPMCLYLWAIWMVRVALGQIAEGRLFGEVVPKLLRRVGLALFGGAVFTVFGIPLMTALRFDKPHIATFEPSPVTLGVVGAALVVFAELLGRAAAMREEIEEFF